MTEDILLYVIKDFMPMKTNQVGNNKWASFVSLKRHIFVHQQGERWGDTGYLGGMGVEMGHERFAFAYLYPEL